MIDQDAYAEVARAAVERLITTQRDAIAEAGRLVADALTAGGVLQAYGTGHSRAVALELVGRAGGLIPANQLAIRDLVYYGDAKPADILDPLLERESGVAERIWALADIRPADVFVIASNSGGNTAVVEMVQLAQSRGHRVIAITSVDHATTAQRSPSLAELADVVIDNGAPWGDAAVPLPEGDRFGPLSGLTGVLAANLLVAEVVGRQMAAGTPSLVYRSANTPGGYERNAEILRQYGGRVRLGDA
ncbi:putative phosphosugar-binding protein [Hamadaea flava]|uniref:Sugar isomerase domain-containing protein n=1 Tax=Hamadaea flava TaxID=1742688 RepID=A0ABV8M0B4_9ACTN|nr:SIS domain-containing protein [Hamadaea flava]MCP2322148.1 putative phosphosugar-binding protein [Hamadaea flava]